MNEKAERTVERISKGIQEGQAACIPELVRVINTLSVKVHDIPVHSLSEMIQNDPVVLQKVIDGANKIGYNPFKIPINSLFGAIQVIGFDRIRILTMAMILFENANKDQYSAERQKAALIALSAGLVTQGLARRSKIGIDEDAAFICGALRGYGLILLATYLPLETAEAESYPTQAERDRAYVEIFGLSPLQLTNRILRHSNMPNSVVESLGKYQGRSKVTRAARLDDIEALKGLSELGYTLSQSAFNPQINAAAFAQEVAKNELKYMKLIEENEEFYGAQLSYAHEYIGKLRRTTSGEAFPEESMNCLKARLSKEDPKIRVNKKASSAAPQKAAAKTAGEVESKEAEKFGLNGTRDFWENSADLLDRFQAEKGLSASAVEQLFRILIDGFQCDEIWLFVLNEKPDHFQLFRTMGTHELLIGKNLSVQTSEKSIFGLCLRRREIMVIGDARAKQMRGHLPKWYREKVDLGAFVLCSIAHQDRPVGLIYIGWKQARNFEIQPDKGPILRRILSKIAELVASPQIA